MIVAHFKADKYPEIKLYAEYFEITSVFNRTFKYRYEEILKAFLKGDDDYIYFGTSARSKEIHKLLGQEETFALFIHTQKGAQWEFDIPDPKNELLLEVVNFLIERIEDR